MLAPRPSRSDSVGMDIQPKGDTAVIWSGALQAAAAILAGRGDAARWGIDQPAEDAAWGGSAGANTARRVVELAAHIILDLPDDPESGLPRAKNAAQRRLKSPVTRPLEALHAQPCPFVHCRSWLMHPFPQAFPLRQTRQHCLGVAVAAAGMKTWARIGSWSGLAAAAHGDPTSTGSDDRNRVGAKALGASVRRNTVCTERSPYPIRKVTTPVPVEGGVAGGALPKSAGTSFHGPRKPNGSACQRRTMASSQAAPNAPKKRRKLRRPPGCRRIAIPICDGPAAGSGHGDSVGAQAIDVLAEMLSLRNAHQAAGRR
jgi:hypothetical protein